MYMEEVHTETTWEHSEDPPPAGPHEPPSTGVNPTVALHPGETLIIYHPHSQCPMRIVPTTELHGPSERAVQHNIEREEDSYSPFPTRADFEQAELFVNHDCSDKLIDNQLTLAHRNGMRLEVKTSRKMHELLARGAGEKVDDYKACFVHFTTKPLHP